MAWPSNRQSSHYLNHCWLIINWTLGNKYLCNLKCNSNIFIQAIAFKMLFANWRPFCLSFNVLTHEGWHAADNFSNEFHERKFYLENTTGNAWVHLGISWKFLKFGPLPGIYIFKIMDSLIKIWMFLGLLGLIKWGPLRFLWDKTHGALSNSNPGAYTWYSRHCGYWCPGAKAPGHHYLQFKPLSNPWYKSHQIPNVSHLVLQLSLPNPLKPGVKSRMKM